MRLQSFLTLFTRATPGTPASEFINYNKHNIFVGNKGTNPQQMKLIESDVTWKIARFHIECSEVCGLVTGKSSNYLGLIRSSFITRSTYNTRKEILFSNCSYNT